MRNTPSPTPGPQDLQPAAGGIVPELLTTKQAAWLAGVGERTWWAWSRSGLAPRPISIGYGARPAVRYRRSDLLQWIQDGCPRTDNEKGAAK
jgi:predicted DNA-binding transcriptional regulator AlpA